MQDPYSSMMHRDGQFFKPYGPRSNMNIPTSYYGMSYPSVSHTMTHPEIHAHQLMSGETGPSPTSGLDFTSPSSSNSQEMLPTAHRHHNHSSPPNHHNNNVHSGDMHMPKTMSEMSPPIASSSHMLPSLKQEHDVDAELSSPSSSGSNPGTPLDLAGGDYDGNHKMPPKKRALTMPEGQKDEVYWEKRKKNNDSAKRSRESRRMKEEQIALRVVFLEQENLQLRTEVSLLKSEIEKLRCMLYNP